MLPFYLINTIGATRGAKSRYHLCGGKVQLSLYLVSQSLCDPTNNGMLLSTLIRPNVLPSPYRLRGLEAEIMEEESINMSNT